MNTPDDPNHMDTEDKDLKQFYDFMIANRETTGADNIPEAIEQAAWVFLSRWQRVKLIGNLLRSIVIG